MFGVCSNDGLQKGFLSVLFGAEGIIYECNCFFFSKRITEAAEFCHYGHPQTIPYNFAQFARENMSSAYYSSCVWAERYNRVKNSSVILWWRTSTMCIGTDSTSVLVLQREKSRKGHRFNAPAAEKHLSEMSPTNWREISDSVSTDWKPWMDEDSWVLRGYFLLFFKKLSPTVLLLLALRASIMTSHH